MFVHVCICICMYMCIYLCILAGCAWSEHASTYSYRAIADFYSSKESDETLTQF